MPRSPTHARPSLLETTPSRGRHGGLLTAAVLTVIATGCATTIASSTDIEPEPPATTLPSLGASESATQTTPTAAGRSTEEAATTSQPAEKTSTTSSSSPTSTTSTSTTSTTSTTTTTEPDPLADVHEPDCVRIADGDGFDGSVAAAGSSITSLWIENGLGDAPAAGDLVDVCIDNGIDDITGAEALRHDDPAVAAAVTEEVQRQQRRLNELFAPFGTTPLAVDGISGPLTGQRLCAARVALGLEPSVADLQPGSIEHATLFAAVELPTPTSSATESERWALIDRTCQWMFVGTGSDLVFAFPTSTGSEGFETRTQDRAAVFRYNPAVDNGGWHDSTEYPVGVDNPLNGNLYKPLYFDLGQAIHGANNVPPEPASKGCARLSVANQERLLDWLGLLDTTEETWRKNEINFTVNVQGEFIGR